MGNVIAPQIEEPGSIDFNSFSGKWYQIARNTNPFQHPQAKNAMSEYQLGPDGSVKMIHSETLPDGKVNQMESKGYLDKSTRGRIITEGGITQIYDYFPEKGFAIIGDPVKGFLWIMSRSAYPEAYDYHLLVNKLKRHGNGLENLIPTYHD